MLSCPDTSFPISSIKTKLKVFLLNKQKLGDNENWVEHMLLNSTLCSGASLDYMFINQGEPSKPLFHSNNLLTIHNLYKYHCIVELFKVIKLRTPMSIYELMKRSERRENYFISLPPSSLFDYQASNFWNKCRKSNSEIDFTTSIKIVKTKLKICLLETQNRHDMFVWHEFNFDTDHFSF